MAADFIDRVRLVAGTQTLESINSVTPDASKADLDITLETGIITSIIHKSEKINVALATADGVMTSAVGEGGSIENPVEGSLYAAIKEDRATVEEINTSLVDSNLALLGDDRDNPYIYYDADGNEVRRVEDAGSGMYYDILDRENNIATIESRLNPHYTEIKRVSNDLYELNAAGNPYSEEEGGIGGSRVDMVGTELAKGSNSALLALGENILKNDTSEILAVSAELGNIVKVAEDEVITAILAAEDNADRAATEAGKAETTATDLHTYIDGDGTEDNKGLMDDLNIKLDKAEAWADNASDEVVETVDGVDKYSAKKWALDSQTARDEAVEAVDTIEGLSIGTVSTGVAGESASVALTTENELTFVIPQGYKGDKGEPFTVNAIDVFSEKINYNGQPLGFSFLSLDGYGPQADEVNGTNWDGLIELDASTTSDWDGDDLVLDGYIYTITLSDVVGGSVELLDDEISLGTFTDDGTYTVRFETVNNLLKLTTDADWDGDLTIMIKRDLPQTSCMFFKMSADDGDYWSEGAPFGVGERGPKGVSITSVVADGTTDADGEYGQLGETDSYKIIVDDGQVLKWDVQNGNVYTDEDAIAAVEGKDGLVVTLSADSVAVTPADDAADEAIATKKFVLDSVATADGASEISYDSDTNTDLEATVDDTEVQSAIESLDAAVKLNTAKETNTVTDLSVVAEAEKIVVESSDGANTEIGLGVEDADDAANNLAGLVKGEERAQIGRNETAVALLNDADDVEGSVAYAVKALADGAVATNTDAIGVLNSDDTVEGSVDEKIKTQVLDTRLAEFQETPDDTHVITEKLAKDSLDAKLDDTQLDTDVLLGGDDASDEKIASQLAAKTYVDEFEHTGDVTGKAELTIIDDVELGGNPTTTTQPVDDESTKIATTQYVVDKINEVEEA